MTPIGLFCYNRPHHLKTCLEAIDRSMAYLGTSLPLYIFCDGAKKEGDLLVEQTRAVARAHPTAHVIAREKNYGFSNITTGITWLCDQFDQAIIIEDDVIIAPDFLPYMTAALSRYRDDPRVFGISGFMYFEAHPPSPSFFFLPQQFIWGWGTWKRAWDHYDPAPKGWRETLNDRKFRRQFDCFNSIKFSKMMEKTMDGTWNTWDIQWLFCQCKAGGLTLFPYRSLVWNCGAGGGTHGDPAKDQGVELGDREGYIHGNLSLSDFQKPRLNGPFEFPDMVAPDYKAMRYLASTFLKEWMRREPRFKWHVKLRLNQLMLPFTRRPSTIKSCRPVLERSISALSD